MTRQGRKPRPLRREEKTYRDDRLFVIATEDTHAPKQYFDVFRNTRIKVRVLHTEDGLSSPDHVLERLDNFVGDYDTIDEDEFWLMLDTDHWIEPNHIDNFSRVCAAAINKGYGLAHSNPCFELWLLLHLTDIDATDPRDQFNRCADVERRLREILGSYSKRNINIKHFRRDKAEIAVGRAEELDESPNDRWPQKTGSHVYRVVKELLSGQ